MWMNSLHSNVQKPLTTQYVCQCIGKGIENSGGERNGIGLGMRDGTEIMMLQHYQLIFI